MYLVASLALSSHATALAYAFDNHLQVFGAVLGLAHIPCVRSDSDDAYTDFEDRGLDKSWWMVLLMLVVPILAGGPATVRFLCVRACVFMFEISPFQVNINACAPSPIILAALLLAYACFKSLLGSEEGGDGDSHTGWAPPDLYRRGYYTDDCKPVSMKNIPPDAMPKMQTKVEHALRDLIGARQAAVQDQAAAFASHVPVPS